jgi:hypothetical protein
MWQAGRERDENKKHPSERSLNNNPAHAIIHSFILRSHFKQASKEFCFCVVKSRNIHEICDYWKMVISLQSLLCILFVLGGNTPSSSAFLMPSSQQDTRLRLSSSTTRTRTTSDRSVLLFLEKGWFGSDNDDDNEDNPLVTREMLQRDLLQDPTTVKRKRKKGDGYKPLDNRDHLPFAVKKITPDPYTHPQVKKAKMKNAGKTKKTDLEHQLTPSRLYSQNGKKEDNASTLLGEFQLDKSTTSGDVIVVGDREYRVEKARCQYKYAGGQRFVMVRKVLEVKEVTRVLKEEALMRQYKQSGDKENGSPPALE